MFEAIGAVIAGVIKVGVPIYVAVLFSSAAVLFLPQSVIALLGLTEIRQENRGYFGAALICSIALLLATWTSMGSNAIKNRLTDRKLRRMMIELIETLSVEEKLVLRRFAQNDVASIQAEISNGIFGGLVAKRILFRSSALSSGHMTFPFNLQPMAAKVLRERPDLLK